MCRASSLLLFFLTAVCSEEIEIGSKVIPECVDVDGSFHRVGESYIGPDGCNNCKCLEGGNACTRRFCQPDVSARLLDEEYVEECKDVDGMKHKLGESYIGPDGCNDCKCMEGGNACTKKLCPDDVDSRSAEAFRCVDNMGVLHEENQTYTHVDGCNTCRCLQGGKGGACTRKFCFKQQGKSLNGCVDHSGNIQPLDKKWPHQDGCNTCLCGNLGPICTEEFCTIDPYQKEEKKTDKMSTDAVVFKTDVVVGAIVGEEGDQPCLDQEGKEQWPGATWLSGDSCNVCTCLGDGSPPKCTKKGCRVRLERLIQRDPALKGIEPGVEGEQGAASISQISFSLIVVLAASAAVL